MKTALLRQLAEHATVASEALYELITVHNLDRDPELRAQLAACQGDYPQALRLAVDAANLLAIALDDQLTARRLLHEKLVKAEWGPGAQASGEADHADQEEP